MNTPKTLLPSVPSGSLTTLPPTWHVEAAAKLNQIFTGIHILFLDATKKAVWLGLFLNAVKERGKTDRSIPYGEFRAWAARNLPDLSYDSITTYMTIGRGVIESGKLQITDYPSFAHDGQLPPGIEKLIEGKTQRQLLLTFKGESSAGHYHPPRELSPADKITAENQHAEALVNDAILSLNVLLMDLDSKTGRLATRVHPHLWKDLLSSTIRVNKHARNLSKRKLSPADKKQETAQKKWDALAAKSRQSLESLLSDGPMKPSL